MKKSKMLEERIRRVTVVFKELGFRISDVDRSENSFSAAFGSDEESGGSFFIDRDSRFLEIAYSFSFSAEFAEFLRKRLEEMLKICYEFGSYFSIQQADSEVAFTVFTKIYYSGLTYRALKECLIDFRMCVEELTQVLRVERDEE